MADPCIHDLDPATCAVCNGAEQRAADDRPERGPWIIAQYDGFCACCPNPIDQGDAIRSDGEGGWLCKDCGDA